MNENGTIRRVASWAAQASGRNWPPEVLEAARACLLDTLGITLGALDEPGGKAVRRVVESWRAEGRARIALGGTTCAAGAALVNGTFAHCLDYDDTHVGATAHLSAPVWSAALAVGQQAGAEGRDMTAAFIAGFESAARLGNGIGGVANLRGWHSTGIFGALGAAVAASVLLKLDEDGIARALGAAATQAGGLTGSFGNPCQALPCRQGGDERRARGGVGGRRLRSVRKPCSKPKAGSAARWCRTGPRPSARWISTMAGSCCATRSSPMPPAC